MFKTPLPPYVRTSHDQTPDGEIVQLRDDGQRPTPGHQEVIELPDTDIGLAANHLLLLVDEEDVGQIDRHAEASVLVDHPLKGDGFPAGSGSTHGLRGSSVAPFSDL